MNRRGFLAAALGAAAGLACDAIARQTQVPFEKWVEAFRARARKRGVSDATYTKVMGSLKPDLSVYALDRAQPEFHEEVWQYLNRATSDWRIKTGQARALEYAKLLERIEREYGVDRYLLLGLWGMESAFGDVMLNPKYMRPVFPALAALAWGEPRRRAYWERELLNALYIVEKGWSAPEDMIGSWAGAMGHTQWMPEAWLNIGVDFDGDGRISPYGSPDDALAGTAQFLVKRGRYRKGEGWGYEASVPEGLGDQGTHPLDAWRRRGVRLAGGNALPSGEVQARLWQPVGRGPVFLLTHNFDAVKSYNPANTYALAVAHLGDRIRGAGPFVQPFPGGERALALSEVQEMQRRLKALGYDPDMTDGRTSKDTMRAIRAFQHKAGMKPEDGYPGTKVLARLREAG